MIGGAGYYFDGLVDTLVGFDDAEVDVLVPGGSQLRAANRARIYESRPLLGVGLLGHLRSILAVKPKSYDVIIVNDLTYALLFATFFSGRVVGRIVYFAHGLEPELLTTDVRALYRLTGFRRRYLSFLRRTGRNVFVSRDLRTKFCELLGHKRSDDAVCSFFVTQPLDPAPSDPSIHQLASKAFVLTVSRVIPEKGFDRMWHVMRKAFAHDPSLQWVVAGDGGYRVELERQVATTEFAERVHFIGRRGRMDLNFLYAKCSAFMLLSEYRESFGLVYLEALSFGATCLGNAYGGVTEVLDGCGALYPIDTPAEVVAADIVRIAAQHRVLEPRSFRQLPDYTQAAFGQRIMTAISGIARNTAWAKP